MVLIIPFRSVKAIKQEAAGWGEMDLDEDGERIKFFLQKGGSNRGLMLNFR